MPYSVVTCIEWRNKRLVIMMETPKMHDMEMQNEKMWHKPARGMLHILFVRFHTDLSRIFQSCIFNLLHFPLCLMLTFCFFRRPHTISR